ncbi:MAG: hypothetical protein WC353_02495 [Candidatus Peribacter sp.]|jgi:hypothetical protein
MGDTVDIREQMIPSLMKEEKQIMVVSSLKEKQCGRHRGMTMELETAGEGARRYSIFVRQHADLLEDFSVGVVLVRDEDMPIILARYNGVHGLHANFGTNTKFEGCHIHKYSDQAATLGLKSEHFADETGEYTTLEEALRLVFQEWKVINYAQHFPTLDQLSLFPDGR